MFAFVSGTHSGTKKTTQETKKSQDLKYELNHWSGTKLSISGAKLAISVDSIEITFHNVDLYD